MSSFDPNIANYLTKVLAQAPIRNADLSQKVSDAVNRGLTSSQSIDELVMSMSKLVETKLDEAVRLHTKAAVPYASARDLLEKSVDAKLLRREEGTYHYLLWYFSDLRNPSHHGFHEYPFDDLYTFIIQTQDALKQTESLAKRPRYVSAALSVTPTAQPEVFTIKAQNLFDGGTPINQAKLEATIGRPDRLEDRIILAPQQNLWEGNYDARGIPLGSFSVRIQGLDRNGAFTSSAGGMFLHSARTCVKCGRDLDSFSLSCPRCGAAQAGLFAP